MITLARARLRAESGETFPVHESLHGSRDVRRRLLRRQVLASRHRGTDDGPRRDQPLRLDARALKRKDRNGQLT